jgi:hypothetical protein
MTRGPSWSGHGVAACDEPGASDVDLPAGVAPPPTSDAEDHVWFEDRWMVASLCDE